MGFKRGNSYDAETAEEREKQKAEELGGKDTGPKIRLQMGTNVFMILPSIDDNEVSHWRFAQVHYRPFHICGRADSAESVGKDGGLKLERDNNFSNCPRCIASWNHYESAGKPEKGPYKKKFRQGMSNQQFLIQVANFTPFFETKSGSPYASPSKDLYDEWMEAFIDVMNGEEPPEDMPEDMVEAAQASPQILICNKDTGEDIRKAYREKYYEKGEQDPVFLYDDMLLQIVRTVDPDKKWTDSKGEERKGYKHAVSFTPLTSKKAKFWEIPERFFEVIDDQMVNLHNPEADLTDVPEDEHLVTRARAFERLSDDEIEEYLKQVDYSYTPEAPKQVTDEGVADPDEFEDVADVDNLNDADAFEDDATLDEDDMQKLEALKDEVAAE